MSYDALASVGDFQAVLTSVAPSIVKISGRGCTGVSFGSGFVAAPHLVITNVHVISGASSVYIKGHQGTYPATPLVVDNDLDIAVLYSNFIDLPPVPISGTQAVVGDQAVTTGYPSGKDLAMKQGQIMAQALRSLHNQLSGLNTFALSETLGPGSSGGPVFNRLGEVIGINDAGYGNTLILIKADAVNQVLLKAKNKILPTALGLCATPPKFY